MKALVRVALITLLAVGFQSAIATPAEDADAAHRAAMQALQFLVGEWRVAGYAMSKEGTWTPTEQSTLSIAPILGGRYLEAEGHMQKLDFRITFGFDPTLKAYALLLLDAGSGAVDRYTGQLGQDAGLTLVNDHGYRWRVLKQRDGSWEMVYEASRDGGKTWSAFGRHVFSS